MTDIPMTRCPYCHGLSLDYLDWDDSFTDDYYARYLEVQCEDCGAQFQLEMDFALVRWTSYEEGDGADLESSDDMSRFPIASIKRK